MEIYSKSPALVGDKTKQIKNSFFFLIGLFGLIFFFFSFIETGGNSLILKEKISQEEPIILSGNTLVSFPSLPESEEKITKKITVIVTAYSSTPWETWGNPFVTAAGTWVKDGIVANNYLPFGTKIRMPEIYGDRVFIVEDRMHSRKGNNHFDIWFSSHSEAVNFGVKRTYVEVLEN